MTATLEVDLDLDTEKTERQAKERLTKAGRSAGKSFTLGFSSALKVGAALVAVQALRGAIAGFTDEIGKSVAASRSLEVFRTQFSTILGSAKAAQKQLSDLQKFAATTPFQLPGLATATRQLLSFGVEQEKIIPTLRQIGELSAGTGSAIEDLTIPYGRLISTQKLTLVELDKFADRGVSLYAKLAEQTGVSLGQVRDDISKGKVDFEEFTIALDSLTKEGGTFFGATLAQSKTLEGLFSTLNDNIFNLRAAIGDSLKPVLKVITKDLISGVQNLTKEFANSGPQIVAKIFEIARSATFLIKPFKIAFNFIAAGFKSLETGISAVVAGLAITVEKFLEKPLELASKFPGKIGESAKKTLTAIQAFSSASQSVLVENAQATQDSLVSLFETGDIDAKLREAIERYKQAGLEGAEAFKRILKAAKETGGKTAKELDNLSKSLRQTLGNNVASAVQGLATSLAKGENLFSAFGQAALGILADFAIQAGGIFIATGIAKEAALSAPGSQLIAAGVGLVALGTLAKTFFGGGQDSGQAGGASSGGGPLATQPEFSAPTIEEREEAQTRVSLTIQGDVLDSEETGLRIANILENAELNQNVRVLGGLA